LSIAPKESCIIEDSTNGVQAAKAAGIFCVGYNSVLNQDLDADIIINHFKELNFNNVQPLDSKLWKN
jgi:beta-phosphoglucomutase-like phosphatase (HAD superfamily)